jgi:hypothetical protein
VAVVYKELVEEFRRDPAKTEARVRESFEKKVFRPRDFDFGRLFEECFGWHEFRTCREKKQLANDVMARALTESQGAVSTAAFQNISGQIVYSAILEKYESEEFVFSKLIPDDPITNGTLDGEKIAGLTEMGDEVGVRKEGDPYPLAGLGENWIFAPAAKDRGVIVPVTWEALFADRTGRLLEYCGDVGRWAGVNKEKRAIDCVVDENTTAHRYNWRTAGQIATYGDNSGSHTWDNLAASNELVDWTDLDAAEQVFNALVDPFTGEPIVVDPRHLIVTKQNEKKALRILNATEIRVATPGYATTGNPTQTNVANPYAGKFEVVSTRLLATKMATDTDWFLGDVSKLARYRVAEPMNVVQAPTNNMDEFKRRIVQQYRVNEIGAFYVREPRAMVKSTVA